MLGSGVLEPGPLLGRLNGFFYDPALFGALNIVVWAKIALQRQKSKIADFLNGSGRAHLVCSSYFRKGPFFGLACFANMPVESELERGARMKSVGILSPSYTLLYRYMHFLENQVR